MYYALNNILDSIISDTICLKRLSLIDRGNAYKSLLLAVMDGAYNTRFPEADNPILERIRESVRALLHIQNPSGYSICDGLKDSINYTTQGPKHIVVCDGFALHDLLYLSYEFETKLRAFLAVNPGGKTKTYEHLIRNCLRLSGEVELTLNAVSKVLARFVGASCQKYDEHDKLVNRQTKGLEAVSGLRRASEKLVEIISRRLAIGEAVLLLADHGYDINPKDFTLYHKWSPAAPSLSTLAPFAVVR